MYYHEEMLPLALLAQALGMQVAPPQMQVLIAPPVFFEDEMKIASYKQDPRLQAIANKSLRKDEILNKIQMRRSPKVIEVKETAVGPGKERQEKLIRGGSRTPTSQSSFMRQESSVTKVASVIDKELQNLLYDPESIDNWGQVLSAPSVMLNIPPNALPMIPPPENTSKEVEQELSDIIDVMNSKPLSNAITKKIDEDLLSIFFEICDKGGVDAMQEDATFLSKDLFKIAIYLKYKFLRPRPSQIAPFYGFKLNADINLEGGNDTPSYPSNQSLQGYALAKFYSDMYPQLRARFYQAADAIALSRLQRGDHFPSDNMYSKLLADAIMGPDEQGQPEQPPVVKAKSDTSKPMLESSVRSTPYSMSTPTRPQDMDPIDQAIDRSIQAQKTASLIRIKKFKHLDKLIGK